VNNDNSDHDHDHDNDCDHDHDCDMTMTMTMTKDYDLDKSICPRHMLSKPLKTTCYNFDKYYFVKNPFILMGYLNPIYYELEASPSPYPWNPLLR
jgi:hypothetical protein